MRPRDIRRGGGEGQGVGAGVKAGRAVAQDVVLVGACDPRGADPEVVGGIAVQHEGKRLGGGFQRFAHAFVGLVCCRAAKGYVPAAGNDARGLLFAAAHVAFVFPFPAFFHLP